MKPMLRLFWCLVFVACGGQIADGQDGGGKAKAQPCTTKVCPNDPEPTAQQIQSCETSRARFENCSSVCAVWDDCINQHIKEVCGADGRQDTTKAVDLVTVTCKPPQECVTCVSK